MNKLTHYIIVSVVLTIMFGCNRTSAFKEKLHELDSQLIAHPDSVYNVLVGMEEEAENVSLADHMYYLLLRADAQNKAYIDFDSDATMLEVSDYYDKNGTANERMRAYYLLGCTYRDMKDVQMELQCFLDAIEKADTTDENCDLYTLAAIYGQVADIYDMQHLPQNELDTWGAYGRIAQKDGDEYSVIKSYEMRLRPYYLLGNTDSVLSISDYSKRRYIEIGDTSSAAKVLGPAISILLDREDYQRASEYLNMMKKSSGYFKDDEIIVPHAQGLYRSMGRYALHCGKIDTARYYFNKLLEKGLKEAGYEGLMNIYQMTEQADSVIKYSKLFAQANDSSHIGKNSETIAQMTAMFNYGHEKRIAENVKEQLLIEKGKSLTMLIIIFSLVLFVALLLNITNRVKRSNINKISILNRELEHKKQQLNNAMKKDKVEECMRLRTSLERTRSELLKFKKADTLAAFFESEIYKLFKRISVCGNDMITNEEWEIMTRLFDTTFSSYTDFIHSGKSMTQDQIKVCMLIRMGFGEKEMSNIMNVDFKRITRIKIQIDQKLFGISNAKELVPNLKIHF